MPGVFSSDDDAELRQAERDVAHAFEGAPFDFSALLVVSNVFRAATAVRNHMEREVLSAHQLSWSAFVVLFVLRVWGEQESHRLAHEAGITGGTLTGVLSTLERRGFAQRSAHPTDGRRVLVAPTDDGLRAIDEIMPLFNHHEAIVTADLSASDRRHLARLLRTVLRTLDAESDAESDHGPGAESDHGSGAGQDHGADAATGRGTGTGQRTRGGTGRRRPAVG